ncbi:MAG: diguanylate cyclase, partial [Deltaproteobacteria bacterium]
RLQELERYQLLVETASDVFYQLDLAGCWTYLNRAWEDVSGYTVSSSLGMPFLESVYPTDLGKARNFLDAVLAGETSCERLNLRLKTATGSYRWIELVARPYGRIGQGICGVTGTLRDVTAKRLAEEALRENEERYRRIFSNIQDIYFESSMGGLIIEVSPSVEAALGQRRDQLVGMPFAMLCDDPDSIGQVRQLLLEQGRVKDFELMLRRRGGQLVPGSVNASLVRDDAGKPIKIVGSIRDISERKQAEKEIRQLAYHDQLTGLPNRSLLRDRMQQALAQARRQNRQMALLFLDLDRFKDVNDTLGHEAGDTLLRQVSDQLKSCVRQSDTVARLGGDEFVILLTSVKTERDPVVVAEKILKLLNRPFPINGKEVFTSTSIGIAMFPNDGEDPETLLKHADMAMYEAKEHGRGHFQFFSEQMHRSA